MYIGHRPSVQQSKRKNDAESEKKDKKKQKRTTVDPGDRTTSTSHGPTKSMRLALPIAHSPSVEFIDDVPGAFLCMFTLICRLLT